MRNLFVVFALLVFSVATFAQGQKLPEGAKYVGADEQERLILQAGGTNSPAIGGMKKLSTSSIKVEGGAQSDAQMSIYAGGNAFGVATVMIMMVQYNLHFTGSYTNSEIIPAYTTILPYVSIPGSPTQFKRAMSFDAPVYPGFTLDIIPGQTPGYNDWPGKATVGVYVFSSQGIGSTKGEVVLNKYQTYEQPEMFLHNPKELRDGSISVQTTRSAYGAQIFAVLRERDGYAIYPIASSDLFGFTDAVGIRTPGLQPGNYRLTISINGISDTIDLRLMRIAGSSKGVSPGSNPPNSGSSSQSSPTQTPSFTGVPTYIPVVVGGLDFGRTEDKKEKKTDDANDMVKQEPSKPEQLQ